MKINSAAQTIVCVVFFMSLRILSFAQNEVWTEVKDTRSVVFGDRSGMPKEFKVFRLDLNAMKVVLNTAVIDSLPGAYSSGPVISIPMPDGSFSRFHVAYTPVMEPALAAQLPMIKTFTAIGVEDPSMIARLDYTMWGFHAMIISNGQWYIIDPVALGNTGEYMVFNRQSSVPLYPFVCGNSSPGKIATPPVDNSVYRSAGPSLRTYRLALACTGEYAAYYGGTVAGAASGMVTSINRVTQVYELELTIRLTLIANNNTLIYLNSSSDPYTNNNGSTMLGQNQTTIDANIGTANYDIGHVFSTGGGGVAYLGCVCSSTNKARGVTGSGAPIGDNFDIDYVAHEMGHQFGGNHTFNSTTGSCGGGNRASSAAYEPGSGTTIMAYAGICGADDIQPHSDAIFHTKSFDEIQIYTTTGGGASCDVVTPTNNTPPTVALPANRTIPKLTSFILTGSATDPNNDPLTYLWEQFDLGSSGSPNSATGNAPLFRDFTPTTSPSRTFPKIQDIVRNTQIIGEILPGYARTMTFRFTARDNKLNGAGVQHDDNVVTITVVDPLDTFKVTSPNTNVTWIAGSTNTVTWKVASTNVSPVNCTNVNILLSVDSGYTFPYTLVSNTLNDGSESVTLPVVTSTKARIKVESVGNIFFDMSNVNFTISSSPNMTTITTNAISSSNLCAGSSVLVPFSVNAAANAGNIFTAQLSNAAGSFTSPVSIGTLTSTTAGTINATIPAGTTTGTGYRIRVVSSNPVVTGSDNGTNLSIFVTPAAAGSITGPATVCAGQTNVVYSVPAIGNATQYVWTVPANVNIISGSTTNSITVNFLSNASSGSISVAGKNNGCANGSSSSIAITVNQPSVASVSIATNTGTIICQNTNVTFTATPANGGTTPVYQWQVNGSNAGTNSTTFSTTSLANNSIVRCIMTSNASCVSNSPDTSNQITMTVNANVTASVNISALPSNQICSGTNVTFTATPVNGGPAPVYTWKNGSTTVGTNSASYSSNSLANGNVITCLMSSNAACVTNPSATSNAITMTVNPNVTASVGIIASPSNQICAGTNVTFSATPVNGGSAPGYQWRIGNTNVGTNSPTYSNASLASGDVISCILTSNAACVINSTATSNAITMTVNPNVTASVGIIVSPLNQICAGTNVTFSATPVNGGSAPAYQWRIGNTNVGTNSPTYSNASLASGDVISCILTSNAPCVINSTATSNAITMTVRPNVTPTVSINASPGTIICPATNVTFTATPSNGGSTPAYQWFKNSSPVGTNNFQYSSSTLADGDVVTCQLTSNATCTTINPVTSSPVVITVNPSITLNSFYPSGGNSGAQITLSGSGFVTVTSVSFNGINASFSLVNNSTLIATVPAGNTSGPITIVGCGQATSSTNFIRITHVKLQLKVAIEGFQMGDGSMREILGAGLCDSVNVSLAETISPNSVLLTDKRIINVNGMADYDFPASTFGNSYYIVINHRNSLQTWSALPVQFNDSVIQYDFTTSQNMAYGNNLISIDGIYAIRSGDVNQDGVIDLLDITNISQNVETFLVGYTAGDLNGDSIVESADFSLIENNLSEVVFRP
jgi:hypothetical protein